MLFADLAVLTPTGLLAPGWLQVRGERIAGCGAGAPPAEAGEPARSLPGHFLVPGCIDLHVHGGGGASYTGGDPEAVARAAAYHRAHGTTRTLASLVTAPLDDLLRAVASLAELAESGLIEGIHLEGPFLSPHHCGAQDPRFLRPPDREALGRLLAAGRGRVRMVTLAPELEGAMQLVRQVVDAGAIASLGHSGADYATAQAAIDAGASAATHLCNAMRPLHHREPGIIGAALERQEVTCELIADGVHLHPALLRLAFRAAPGRVALVTDAIVAAGAPDGSYPLGPVQVRVREGRATLEGTDTIAGSTITTGAALAYAAGPAGVPLAAAAEAAARTPARLLGIDRQVGSIEAGKLADLLVLDGGLALRATVQRGRLEQAPEGGPLPSGP